MAESVIEIGTKLSTKLAKSKCQPHTSDDESPAIVDGQQMIIFGCTGGY